MVEEMVDVVADSEAEVVVTTTVAEAVCPHNNNNNIHTKAGAEVTITFTIVVTIKAKIEHPLATTTTTIILITKTAVKPTDNSIACGAAITTIAITTDVVVNNGDWPEPQSRRTNQLTHRWKKTSMGG